MYERKEHGTRRHYAWPTMAASLCLLLSAACMPRETERQPRLTLFIGIDVSGSFQNTGHFDDALRFTAHYIYAHMNELGGLDEPNVLFVGSIGGERPGQPKSFHPIHDFKGRSVDEITDDLRGWFRSDDAFTDFNPFFERVAAVVKQRNLMLKPISIVVISDGVPDITASGANGGDDRYKKIDLDQLEYLSRNVTVRLLYANPQVAVHWEQDIPRRRVRMWTVDGAVMEGWRNQIVPGASLENQEALWIWIAENVDFRVRRRLL